MVHHFSNVEYGTCLSRALEKQEENKGDMRSWHGLWLCYF